MILIILIILTIFTVNEVLLKYYCRNYISYPIARNLYEKF